VSLAMPIVMRVAMIVQVVVGVLVGMVVSMDVIVAGVSVMMVMVRVNIIEGNSAARFQVGDANSGRAGAATGGAHSNHLHFLDEQFFSR